MKLHINGKEKSFAPPLTLTALVETLGMKPDRLAVELNRDIVPRDRWSHTDLHEGDQLEIVHFVGGGGPGADASSCGFSKNASSDRSHQNHALGLLIARR